MTVYDDIGVLPATPVTRNDFNLNVLDSTDVFEFRIDTTQNINLSLTNISAGDDADLRLYQDNGNGFFDTGDQLVDSSTRGSNADDFLNRRADAGTYFAEVSRFSTSSGDVSYNLALSATTPNSSLSGFSNLLPREFALGDLSGDVTRFGTISNTNTTDTYEFSLGLFEGVDITLSGLQSDADIRLIADYNNNRIVDAGEEVARSTSGGITSEVISNTNLSGNYFLQVNQFSSTQTAYTLTFDQFTTTDA
ncbi:MAG: pre-peptidase C-terminal domain-containing protein [Nostoc sp. DedQUE04]|uniref:pre-peptidase C-terminal domain-containing protein n=1 Tax=Nostoc sp. DedQUE04 TaxID=3075390 RepID=UPI002AD2271F|nr:pre-peptidase C-terminal domain-containing protein [Nostoc sp. DedQUE04]MDZ8139394.1 pre-peptidase C-terminal domain-containing protein [Nostoc sp. DedQUE04]